MTLLFEFVLGRVGLLLAGRKAWLSIPYTGHLPRKFYLIILESYFGTRSMQITRDLGKHSFLWVTVLTRAQNDSSYTEVKACSLISQSNALKTSSSHYLLISNVIRIRKTFFWCVHKLDRQGQLRQFPYFLKSYIVVEYKKHSHSTSLVDVRRWSSQRSFPEQTRPPSSARYTETWTWYLHKFNERWLREREVVLYDEKSAQAWQMWFQMEDWFSLTERRHSNKDLKV